MPFRGNDKAIVGLAEAISDPYPDPKENSEKLVVIDIKAKRRLPRSLELAEIKATDALREFDLVRLPRLSVISVGNEHWEALQQMLK